MEDEVEGPAEALGRVQGEVKAMRMEQTTRAEIRREMVEGQEGIPLLLLLLHHFLEAISDMNTVRPLPILLSLLHLH